MTMPRIDHDKSAAHRLRFCFGTRIETARGYDKHATLPAAMLLRSPPRGAYAAPSSERGKSTQRPKSGLTRCPIRPFAPLHVRIKDLTADIFYPASRRASALPLVTGRQARRSSTRASS